MVSWFHVGESCCHPKQKMKVFTCKVVLNPKKPVESQLFFGYMFHFCLTISIYSIYISPWLLVFAWWLSISNSKKNRQRIKGIKIKLPTRTRMNQLA